MVGYPDMNLETIEKIKYDGNVVATLCREKDTGDKVLVDFKRNKLRMENSYSISKSIIDEYKDEVSHVYIVDLTEDNVYRYSIDTYSDNNVLIDGDDERIDDDVEAQYAPDAGKYKDKWSKVNTRKITN